MSASNTGAWFSVVIVNYNGGAMLRGCVRSALHEGVPAPQIIIVDSGSQDDSIENLKRSVDAVGVIRNSCNAGFARAVNQGIKRATALPATFDCCGKLFLIARNTCGKRVRATGRSRRGGA